MDSIDAAEADVLHVVMSHPSRGVVVCRAVHDSSGKVTEFVVLRANNAASALLGVSLAPGRRLGDVLGPAGPALIARLVDLVATGGFASVDVTIGTAGDPPGLPPTVDAGAVGDRVVLLLDRDGGHATVGQWFRTLVEAAVDVIHVLDREGVTRYVSPGAAEVLGHPPEQVVGRHLEELMDPRDRAFARDLFAAMAASPPGTVVEDELRVRYSTDDVRWVHFRGVNHLGTPGVDGVVVSWRDITGSRDLRDQLEHAATHDHLTALANRALFIDHLELARAHVVRHPAGRVAVLFCDLDGLKRVNDSVGQAAGNSLLRQVAQRLREAVRPGDTVARLGDDEFAVLCPDLTSEHEAAALAHRVRRKVAGRYQLEAAPDGVLVGVSVGVSISEQPPQTAADMLREADTALYEVKRSGRGRVALFDERLRDSVNNRLRIESELRRALTRTELVLHYQPKLDLRTRRITGAEALVRWEHTEQGLVGPDAFLPLAEESGLILPLGLWMLRTAVQQLSAWSQQRPDLHMQVNLGARELAQASLLSEIDAATTDCHIDPTTLEVEITESAALADLTTTISTVSALRTRGIHVSLDDFGTGFSSLSWLQQIPTDSVKLDLTVTSRLGESPPTTAITEAVIALSHALDRVTIAEGVETAAQLAELSRMHCDYAQGFFIGHPVPAEDFLQLAGAADARLRR